jgi:hypothetical protein
MNLMTYSRVAVGKAQGSLEANHQARTNEGVVVDTSVSVTGIYKM